MGDYSQGMGWDILSGCQAPTSPENLTALKAWAQAEGGEARWNPFNTKEPWPGATLYNHEGIGVKNYPNMVAGVKATVATLQNGLYPNILAALKKGNNPYDVAHAIAASPWGTGNRVVQVLDGWGPQQVPPWYLHGPYRQGSPTSYAVKVIQAKVHVSADGVFGPITRGAVIAYQAAHHLAADGIVGPLTARVMGPA